MGLIRRLTPLLAVAGLTAGCESDLDFTPRVFEEPAPAAAPIDHGAWLSMDAAPDGQRLAMAYYDRERGGLGFAVGTPVVAEDGSGTVSWAHERVDGYEDPNSGLDVGDRGKYASMKVAPDGTVWIAYYDAGKKSLYYAHRLGGPKSWVTGEIDAGTGSIPATGEWASLALDSNGRPVVAYHAEDEGSLRIARLAEDQDDTTPEYEWVTETLQTGQPFSGVDAEGNPINREARVGEFARLEIVGGTEYIAYYDAGQQRLGFLEGVPGAYTQTFVTPEGANMGAWPSILVEGGTVQIAFHDVGEQDLVIATRGAQGWDLDIADSGEFVGADTELIKRAGNLAVLYFDGQNNNMKFTEKSGATWLAETLTGEGAATGFHNEIVRLGGAYWAASYDYTNRQVVVSRIPDGGTE